MRVRRMGVAAMAALAAVLAGCGAETEAPPGPGTVLTFSVDLEGAEREGRLIAGSDPTEVLASAVEVVRVRLRAFGMRRATVSPSPPLRFDVFVPDIAEETLDTVVRLVAATGDLRFRIEVLPDHAYREVPSDAENQRVRFGVWPSGEDFEAWKEEEFEIWKQAHDSASAGAYRPRDPRWRLVKRHDSQGLSARDFAVVEEPQTPQERFDGSILADVGIASGWTGVPATLFTLKPDRQQDFERWTARNVQLPMAIILDGEYHSAPYVMSPLRDRVQVTLGIRDLDEAKRGAEILKATLAGGPMPARARLRAKNTVPAPAVK